MVRKNKGQAHLLETFGGLFIIIVALVIVINAPITDKTPADSITIDKTEEIQNYLSQLNKDAKFKDTFLRWNASQEPNTNNTFKHFSLLGNEYFYNINFTCDSQQYVYTSQGNPSQSNFVYNSYFTLYDNDKVNDTKIVNKSNFICNNQDTNSNYYNQVKVKVIVWTI